MYDLDDRTAPAQPCAVCDRPSDRRVHPGCQQRLADRLAALPGLYRALAAALVPGRRGDGGRSGTRTAPLPCNEDVVSLRARGEETIVGILMLWEDRVRDALGWDARPFRGAIERDVDASAAFLQTQLPWICEQQPDAIRQFADDIRRIAGHAEAFAGEERPPRSVPVACSCGQTLRVTVHTSGARCPGCERQYGRTEVLQLPIAVRVAA